jgi:hypothetical protein
VPYEKTPFIEPSYTPSPKKHEKLLEALLEDENFGGSIINQMVAIERFESILDIKEHQKSPDYNPVPLAHHNQWSRYSKHSIATRMIRTILELRIPQRTNMSLSELFNLPTEEFRVVMMICRDLEMKRGAEVEMMSEQLDLLGKGTM